MNKKVIVNGKVYTICEDNEKNKDGYITREDYERYLDYINNVVIAGQDWEV